jgi:hypothetical protein
MNYNVRNFILAMFALSNLLLYISCNEGEKETRTGEPLLLSGKLIEADSSIFSDKFITIIDSMLYMDAMNGSRDSLINIYQIKGDSLITRPRLFSAGIGPYEGFIVTGLYDSDSHQFFLFENHGMLKDGYVIDINQDIDVYNTSLWKKLDFSKIKNYRIGHSYTYLNDTALLVVGGVFDKPNILTIINPNSQETIPLSYWINDASEQNLYVQQAVYVDEAKIFHNKILDKYLYVCGSGRYMELFKLNDYEITQRTVVESIIPKYEVESDGVNYHYKRNFKHRGLKISVTDNFIYAKREEYTTNRDLVLQSYKGYSFYYNDIIDIYDWNGNWIKCYRTDTPFADLLVSPTDNIIYTTTCDLETGEIIIKKYQL